MMSKFETMPIFIDIDRTVNALADTPMALDRAERLTKLLAELMENKTALYDTGEDRVLFFDE